MQKIVENHTHKSGLYYENGTLEMVQPRTIDMLSYPPPPGKRLYHTPGEVLIYFSVRGRAAEQGIIFRIQTPGQVIIFVQIGSMTGSIFFIFDSESSF